MTKISTEELERMADDWSGVPIGDLMWELLAARKVVQFAREHWRGDHFAGVGSFDAPKMQAALTEYDEATQ